LIEGKPLVAGRAEGPALVLDEPLSFWGGIDPETGRIVQVGHPQRGEVVRGRILVMPSGRGSSSSATVLAESIRLGTGPAGIVLAEVDGIIAIGALVAANLYGVTVPVVVAQRSAYAAIRAGAPLSLG
jgi:predicted aconitase with swiveling domain